MSTYLKSFPKSYEHEASPSSSHSSTCTSYSKKTKLKTHAQYEYKRKTFELLVDFLREFLILGERFQQKSSQIMPHIKSSGFVFEEENNFFCTSVVDLILFISLFQP